MRRDIGQAVSEENIDLMRAMAEAFNRPDWDAFLAHAHDEIDVESRLVPLEGAFRGHQGLHRWWDSFLGAFPITSLRSSKCATSAR